MKKLKLRCLTDLPKVSKIIRPGVVTQMQIFKLQIPSKCPLHAHPPITVAGSSLPEESRAQPSQEPSKRDRLTNREAEALISTVKPDFLQEPLKASNLVQSVV